MEVIVAMVLSALCTMAIAVVYRFTHRGTGYSQSYVQSLLLLGLITTLIMVVIGSNIARAFSLVGALSIIRFRNAVKETRDVTFIYFAMAIAMACGTRFYAVAILATVFICLAIVMMHVANFGASRITPERLLSVQLSSGLDPVSALEPAFARLFRNFSLVSLENVRQGMYLESVWSVRPFENTTPGQVVDEISRVNSNMKIRYHNTDHTDEL